MLGYTNLWISDFKADMFLDDTYTFYIFYTWILYIKKFIYKYYVMYQKL